MQRALCLLLIALILLTPALCLGHACEHGCGTAPHFHTHQLPLGNSHHDQNPDDHDEDAVPVPDMTIASGFSSLDLLASAFLAIPAIALTEQGTEPIPFLLSRTGLAPALPVYLSTLPLRL